MVNFFMPDSPPLHGPVLPLHPSPVAPWIIFIAHVAATVGERGRAQALTCCYRTPVSQRVAITVTVSVLPRCNLIDHSWES